MKKVTLVIMVFVFLISCTCVSAQDNNQDVIIVSLESAWEMMEKHNIELQLLLIDQEILLREAENKKYWIPGINAGASLSRNSPLISWVTNPQNTDLNEVENWSMRGSVDLRLNLNFNISLEDKIEVIELSILMLQRQSRIEDLKVSLQKLYYQILTGFNTIELQEQSLALAQIRLEQIEIQYKQGLRSDLELLTAKIAAAKDLPTLEKARVEQEKRLITFLEYIGLSPGTTIELRDYPAPSTDLNLKLDTMTLQNLINENLQTAELQIKLAEINKELASNNLFAPSLNLNLGWSTGINPLFDPASWSFNDWNDSLGFGLSFSVPISSHIEGSEGKLSLQKQEDNINKMKLSLVETREDIKKQYQFLILDFELSRSNIKVSELNVTLQEQNFRKIQVNFDSGRSSLLDLNDSRQELRVAKLSLENEKLNQRLILIDLERLTGVLN